MYKNEVFNILRSLSRAELRKFRKFLNSDYFGKKSKAVELLDAVTKYHPMYTHVNLERYALTKLLYPSNNSDSSTLRNLFSDMHDAALHFLMIKNFEASGDEKYNFLFNELQVKGLHGEFFKILDKIENDSESYVDWLYFLNKHFRENNKFNFSHHAHKIKKQSNVGSDIHSIDVSVNELIYFFVMELSSLYLNYIFYEHSFDASQYKGSISRAVSLLDFNKLREVLKDDQEIFVVDLYESMLKAFKSPADISLYYAYKECVMNNFTKMSKDEKNVHYLKMITYCVLGSQNKYTGFDYDSELLQMYDEMLKGKYYEDRNTRHLPHEIYRNILTHGVRMRNFDWLEGFVREYSFMVFPEDRQNMFFFGNAYLSLHRGNYGQALEYINNIDLSFFIYKIDIKNIALMSYYELGDIEGTLNMVTSYKEFIRKNKIINPDRKKRYIGFSKFIEKMILYRSGDLKQDISYLKHRLNQNNSIAFKPWLMQKISQLTPGIKKSA